MTDDIKAKNDAETRIRQLELHAYGIDIKLDTLIESVKEVSEVVKKLAEISHNQSIFQERLYNIQNQHNALESKYKESQAEYYAFTEKGMTHITTMKTWGVVIAFILTVSQGFVGFFADKAYEYVERTNRDIKELSISVERLDTKVKTSTILHPPI